MSGCDVDRLEALIEGTLDGARAAEARAHLAGCPGCQEEARWLREERRLFRTRAPAPAAAPPPFAAVLTEVRGGSRAPVLASLFSSRSNQRQSARPGRLGARAPWLGLAAAAALAVFATSRREAAPPEVTPEAPPSFACYDDPRSLVVEATAYATDRAIASAEDLYGACLVATPRAGSTCALPIASACGLSSESDVTCGPLRPSDDEIFESRIRGGSLQ